jgi:hypothetical protein
MRNSPTRPLNFNLILITTQTLSANCHISSFESALSFLLHLMNGMGRHERDFGHQDHSPFEEQENAKKRNHADGPSDRWMRRAFRISESEKVSWTSSGRGLPSHQCSESESTFREAPPQPLAFAKLFLIHARSKNSQN